MESKKTEITSLDIFNSTSNCVLATDIGGYIVQINTRALRMLGQKRPNVINKNVVDILPLTGKLVTKCLESGRPQLGSHIHGKKIEIVVNVTPIRKERKLIGAVCNFQTMQEFENSAKRLDSYKRLNRQLNAIFQYSSEIIWLYDGQGRVIDINPAAEKVVQVKANDFIGMHYDEIIEKGWIPRSVVPEVIRHKRRVTILYGGGEVKNKWMNTGTPVLDESGNIEFIIVNTRELDELERMKAQLEENRMVVEKIKEELAELTLGDLKSQEIIAGSEEMRHVLKTAFKLAKMEVSNFLILGESGTGKGILSKFLHENSKRRKNAFIQINCAALPESLLESELFGYEKGAFTGAREDGKAGLFELAHEGTLFLDEIGDLPLSVQAKLLTYLDNQEVMRLGGQEPKKLDCTIIAATNRDLKDQVNKGVFRQDLFFRLEAFTIQIPPLRERPDDIFELTKFFLDRYNKKYKRRCRIGANALKKMLTYPFPGNVRQLKNALKMAVVMNETDIINELLLSKLETEIEYETELDNKQDYTLSFNEQILLHEKKILKRAMSKYESTRRIAKHLKMSKTTVARKIQKHGIAQNAP